MIAIDVTMVPTAPGGDVTFDSTHEFFNVSYHEIIAFFKECIDQNLVINTVNLDDHQTTEKDVSRYYSISLENAQEFQRRWEDDTRVFSMKKLHDEAGCQVSFSTSEIDFDSVHNTVEIVAVNNNLWGWTFPV